MYSDDIMTFSSSTANSNSWLRSSLSCCELSVGLEVHDLPILFHQCYHHRLLNLFHKLALVILSIPSQHVHAIIGLSLPSPLKRIIHDALCIHGNEYLGNSFCEEEMATSQINFNYNLPCKINPWVDQLQTFTSSLSRQNKLLQKQCDILKMTVAELEDRREKSELLNAHYKRLLQTPGYCKSSSNRLSSKSTPVDVPCSEIQNILTLDNHSNPASAGISISSALETTSSQTLNCHSKNLFENFFQKLYVTNSDISNPMSNSADTHVQSLNTDTAAQKFIAINNLPRKLIAVDNLTCKASLSWQSELDYECKLTPNYNQNTMTDKPGVMHLNVLPKHNSYDVNMFQNCIEESKELYIESKRTEPTGLPKSLSFMRSQWFSSLCTKHTVKSTAKPIGPLCSANNNSNSVPELSNNVINGNCHKLTSGKSCSNGLNILSMEVSNSALSRGKKKLNFLKFFKRSSSTKKSADDLHNSLQPSAFKRDGDWSRNTSGNLERYQMNAALTNQSQEPFEFWRRDQVASWLSVIGLGMYTATCRSNIDCGANLMKLKSTDYERILGIKNSLHKKKLHLALRSMQIDWRAGNKFELLNYMWVAKWLDDLGLSQYKESFMDARVDGRILFYLTFDDLTQLGVVSVLHQHSIGRAIQCLRTQNWEPNSLVRRPPPLLQDNSHEEDFSVTNIRPVLDADNLLLWSNHRVMEWLRSIDLSEYAPNLRGSGVHGALMLLEPKFTGDTLADVLAISPQKTLLRRHLNTHFIALIGKVCHEIKRYVELQPCYQPLSPLIKLKPKKRFQRSKKIKDEDLGGNIQDLVCPLEFEVPEYVPHCVLPIGYLINNVDISTICATPIAPESYEEEFSGIANKFNVHANDV